MTDWTTLKEQETEHRRQTILRKASSEFVKYGFDGASLTQISKALGMSSGAIYHYYPSKPALAIACLLHGYQTLQAVLKKQTAESAEERLMAFMKAAAEEIHEQGLWFVDGTPEWVKQENSGQFLKALGDLTQEIGLVVGRTEVCRPAPRSVPHRTWLILGLVIRLSGGLKREYRSGQDYWDALAETAVGLRRDPVSDHVGLAARSR